MSEGRPEAQPILLTLDDARPNDAAYLFLVDSAAFPSVEALQSPPLERVILMFDGRDPDAVDAARAQWKALKGSAHVLTYWQQTEGGRWEKARIMATPPRIARRSPERG